ncbi:MAG TPA: amidohydrolase [Candidatus Eisenbacteria bacterium]
MSGPHADLLIANGRLWTREPLARDANGLAVRGGRIVAIGTAESLAAHAGPRTVVIDAAGGTVTPGITDAHIHLVSWARSDADLALRDAASAADAAARVACFAARRPGATPVVGRGWDANGWKDAPHLALLDGACPGRPVLLHSHDFHALWVNGAALEAAGVHAGLPDPPGGRIERDAAGRPTGVVREHAVRLFQALEGGAARESDQDLLERAVRRLHAAGITAVHDFEGAAEESLLRAMAGRGGARVRVLMHLPHAGLDRALARGLESGIGDDDFRTGALKIFADGTLGSRTAALLEPYDGTEERGMELLAPAELARDVARALAGGLAIAIHAIGDRACRTALDAFEAARDLLARPRLPSRLEHLQLVDDRDLPRLARLGIAASVQPSHCTSDLDLIERWWNSRRARAYAYRSLAEGGALLAFGSDAPVEAPEPIRWIHAAVTRQRPDGSPPGGFVPAQRLALDAALAACTEGGARLAGSADRLGRLAPGCLADLVVWDRDLFGIAPERLIDARPAATVLAGKIVYRDGEAVVPEAEGQEAGRA